MFSGLLLLPRHYSFQSSQGISSCRPKIPQREIVCNRTRYFIFQLQDRLRRICNDKTLLRDMKECNEKFKNVQSQYLETCAYYDDLCLRHPMVHSIQEDYSFYYPLHYEDFETRYACRMAEIKHLKQKYAQKLTVLRLQYLSFYCAPILNCLYQIVGHSSPSLTPDFFCCIGKKEDESVCTLLVLQWMFYWLANNFLEIKNPREQADQLVSNIECYIDEVSMRNPELYLELGGPSFTNLHTRKYLETIQLVVNRREAFCFLLATNRIRNSDSNYLQNKYLQLRRETAELTFFHCDDVIQLVVSFLMGNSRNYTYFHLT